LQHYGEETSQEKDEIEAAETGGSKRRAIIRRLIDKFRRHGPAYLLISRFLPGIRALVFVAAGASGMSLRAVIFYGTASALLWNLFIVMREPPDGQHPVAPHLALPEYPWLESFCGSYGDQVHAQGSFHKVLGAGSM